ncbi:flagellar motor protein MotB [Paenibacillus macquariensis]|uniref:Chemotaxis protein MotB n=1 Tax=Paenibacillus macquariensis TaxID=948756 RepID=A0ABY1K6N3_9BACL|nr:flagellar motor protein MotB [Paenibacillus macquariensis]MEC0093606.1 flagellar motor protein MotB [Paenibacillus macquariensis]OAB35575.1 flagellar motor protein [Paenibacillus macquariensis subsp. macquariensis]SIR33263.1 chemotaxis protein MotB [Paenibacillus macquariensis]
MRQQTRRPSRGRGNKTEHGSRDRWLITYADLITLLLIFFVMMYAMSTLDKSKYDDVTQSLQLTFKSGDSILEEGSGITGTADKYTHKNPDTTTTPPAKEIVPDTQTQIQEQQPQALTERELAFRQQEQELQGLMSVISKYVSDNQLDDQIFVADKPQGISITLSDQFVFDAGRADLKSASGPVLAKLASLFKNLGTTVSIEGHTDNVPITNSSKYKDNWELSGARALSILRFFLEQENLKPEGFQYAGYADTRPVGDNTTTLGRQSNRRVQIIVLRQLQE